MVMREHSIDEARERAALYALGALRGEEAQEFERHLHAGCALCAAELETWAAVAADLGRSAAPCAPRPAVRARLLERIAAEQTLAQQPIVVRTGVHFVRAAGLDWQAGTAPGVEIKTLFADPARGYLTRLVRMPPGSSLHPHRHADVEESYVLEGDLMVSGVSMKAGDYCRAEAGSVHTGVSTRGGCLFIAVCSERDERLEV
jgi:anti-sigma factor ChrR (cupin superfamily)